MADLNGIKEIARYLNLSESTVIGLIMNRGLPAKKDEARAVWFARKKEIDEWNKGGRKYPENPTVKKDQKKRGRPKKKSGKKALDQDGDSGVK